MSQNNTSSGTHFPFLPLPLEVAGILGAADSHRPHYTSKTIKKRKTDLHFFTIHPLSKYKQLMILQTFVCPLQELTGRTYVEMSKCIL